MDFLSELSHTQSIKTNSNELTLDYLGDETDQVALLRTLIERGYPVRSFSERGITIEDVILNLEETP